MRFKIFNPSTVEYETFEYIEDAKARRDELHLFVSEQLFPYPTYVPPECSMVDAWQAAEEFYAQKTGGATVNFSDAAAVAFGASTSTFYNHSVYNLTTQAHWSRTFGYFRDDSLFHIKVQDGVVTDWYQHQGEFDGVKREWVAFDLQSGAPIEYYDFTAPTLTKTNVATGDVTAEWVMGETPPTDFLSRVPSTIDTLTIFAYSSKTYGDIIEYREPYNEATTSKPVRTALAVLETARRTHVDEQRSLTEAQIVVLAEKDNADGTYSTSTIDNFVP
jgi:hypothetical protein